jgi:hypothetical protein
VTESVAARTPVRGGFSGRMAELPIMAPAPSAVALGHHWSFSTTRSWGVTHELIPDEEGVERVHMVSDDTDLPWEQKAWMRNWISYAMRHHVYRGYATT